MTTTVKQDTPSFENPPINEVVCGCQFQPLERLKMPHLGRLWEHFKEDFPSVEHAPPYPTEEGQFLSDYATGLPLPRVWFINEKESRLIQFQADRYYYNWRKRDGGCAYPRFPTVIGEFSQYLTTVERFASEAGLGLIQPVAWELTYINHLPAGEGWESLDDISDVFRDFQWIPSKGRFLPTPKGVGWQAAFDFPDDKGSLIAKLSQGKRISDDRPMFVLELAARGISVDRSANGMSEWFDMAHEWIVNGFADLTTPEIQKNIWKRVQS